MWSMEKHSGFPTLSTNRMINLTSFERLGRLQDLKTADYLANTLALVELRASRLGAASIGGYRRGRDMEHRFGVGSVIAKRR